MMNDTINIVGQILAPLSNAVCTALILYNLEKKTFLDSLFIAVIGISIVYIFNNFFSIQILEDPIKGILTFSTVSTIGVLYLKGLLEIKNLNPKTVWVSFFLGMIATIAISLPLGIVAIINT